MTNNTLQFLSKKLIKIYWILASIAVIFCYSLISPIFYIDHSKELILHIFTFIFGITFLIKAITQPLHQYNSNILKFLVQLFFVYITINIFITGAPLNEGLIYIGKLFTLAVTIYALSVSSKDTFISIFKGLTLIGVCAVVASFFITTLTGTKFVLPVGHIANYSDFLILMLPWSFYFLLRYQTILWRLTFFITTALFTTGIIIAARKASILAFLLSSIICLIILLTSFKEISKKAILKVGAIFLVVGMILFCLINISSLTYQTNKGTIHNRVQKFFNNNSPHYRLIVYKRSLQAIRERPILGWGYGNYKFVYPKFTNADDHPGRYFNSHLEFWLWHPHNELLLHLFEGGFVGLLLILSILFFLFYFLWRQIRSLQNHDKILGLIVFLGLFSILFSNLFTSTVNTPVIRLVLVFYLALAYQLTLPFLPKIQFTNPKFVLIKLKQSLLILIFLGACFFSVSQSISNLLLLKAQNDVLKNKKTEIHHWALKLTPGTFRTLIRSAYIEAVMKNDENIEKYLTKSLKIFPFIPYNHLKLCALYIKQKRWHEAKAILQKGLELYPHDQYLLDQFKQIPDNE